MRPKTALDWLRASYREQARSNTHNALKHCADFRYALALGYEWLPEAEREAKRCEELWLYATLIRSYRAFASHYRRLSRADA